MNAYSASTKGVLIVIATALTIIALNSTPACAQASMSDFILLSQEKKFFYISGFLDGFAFAAQLPDEQAALLQRCSSEFGTTKTVNIFETWIANNREKVRDPKWTARLGIYAALAEA